MLDSSFSRGRLRHIRNTPDGHCGQPANKTLLNGARVVGTLRRLMRLVTRARAFVGRERELSVLEELLRADAPAVVHVHGIAGIGKSALVTAVADRLRAADVDVAILDCRTIEPTERGAQEALEQAFASHTEGNGSARSVLVLDHYEVFRLMDTWLRQVLMPSLAPGTCVLLSGRERPSRRGSRPPGFRSVPLGPLGDADSNELLAGMGIGAADAMRITASREGIRWR